MQSLNLKQQNEKLREENEAIKKDIAKVAIEVKQAWESLGLDLSMFAGPEKPNQFKMMQIAGKVIAKVSKGESIANLTSTWNSIAPILEKYQHLIKEENV